MCRCLRQDQNKGWSDITRIILWLSASRQASRSLSSCSSTCVCAFSQLLSADCVCNCLNAAALVLFSVFTPVTGEGIIARSLASVGTTPDGSKRELHSLNVHLVKTALGPLTFTEKMNDAHFNMFVYKAADGWGGVGSEAGYILETFVWETLSASLYSPPRSVWKKLESLENVHVEV